MASNLKRIGDLDIHQDLDFQHRSWTLQRIGWTIMGLLVLSGLLGVFGHGPLSHTVATDPSIPLSLEYERFGRYHSPLTLRVQIQAGAVQGGKISLWFSHEYLRAVQIHGIRPEPAIAQISPVGTTYVFPAAQPGQGGEILVHLEADDIGLLSGRFGLTESRSIPFGQWIYP